MERELSQGEFLAFLSDTRPALRAYLEPPAPPKMAFDAMPEPEDIALMAEVMSHLAKGDFDGHAIAAARRWSTKMLRGVNCNITPGTVSDIAVRKFMRQRVAEWPDHLPAPTEAEDVAALQCEFPRRLTRKKRASCAQRKHPTSGAGKGRGSPGEDAAGRSANPPICAVVGRLAGYRLQ